MELSLRSRQKADRRGRMVAAALELFDRHGFANVRVEHVADYVGVSARTVHRYFPVKEDLVLSIVDEVNREFLDAVRASESDRPLFTVLGDAMSHAVAGLFERISEDDFRIIYAQIAEVDSIRARALLHNATVQAELTELVTARPQYGPRRVREAALAAAVFAAAVHTAQSRWRTAEDAGETLVEEFRATLSALPGVVGEATATAH